MSNPMVPLPKSTHKMTAKARWGLLASVLGLAACDRHPPPDLGQPATASTMQLPDRWIDPLDVVMAYNEQVGDFSEGGSADYSVAVTNRGTLPLRASGPHPVFVTYRWLTAEGKIYRYANPQTTIDRDIPPGQTTIVRFKVIAPTEKGRYLLKVVMGTIGRAEFDQGGQAPLHYGATVR